MPAPDVSKMTFEQAVWDRVADAHGLPRWYLPSRFLMGAQIPRCEAFDALRVETHWPERKDERPCGCHWKRVPHGWGGWYYNQVTCGGCRPAPCTP